MNRYVGILFLATLMYIFPVYLYNAMPHIDLAAVAQCLMLTFWFAVWLLIGIACGFSFVFWLLPILTAKDARRNRP
jgi:hypothetical protein